MPDPDAQPDPIAPGDLPTVDSGAGDPSDLPTVGSGAGDTVDSSADQPTAGLMGRPAGPSRAALGLDQPQPEHAPSIPGYHITGRLGEGGMGVVWRAVQLATHRQVALKVMGTAMFASEQARRRFEREVELAARLEHPGIARVYDSGLAHGAYYYAMQLVPGTTLDLWISAEQPGRRETVALMRDICLAVQHAHQRGVIHRDLKPANIIIVPPPDPGETTHASVTPMPRTGETSASILPPEQTGPRPVLVDFGLAKPAIDDGAGVSLTGQVAGTPAYMSPEQAAGKLDELDTRTDVYSLGVILYKLLTGKLPHDMDGALHVVVQRLQETQIRRPRTASDRASHMVDTELETVLFKALEKDPDRRYPSAGALANDLSNYLAGDPLTARPPSLGYLLRKRAVKYRRPLIAAAGVALALVLGTGTYAYKQYHAQVVLPVASNPPGATLVVDGVVQHGCGKTPCQVMLGPGVHTVELLHEGQRGRLYKPVVRTVRVAWGKANLADIAETINLVPAYQTVRFVSDVPGTLVTVVEEETGAVVGEPFATPNAVVLDRGRYRYTVQGETSSVDATGHLLEIDGNTAPVEVRVGGER